jgi:hypothetical protein
MLWPMTRPPSDWTHADVLDAVKRRAAETETLDFKRDLYTDTKEFAGDLVAMANSDGGVIVLGVEEDPATRRASAAVGVQVSEPNTLWMTNAAASLVDPRLNWEAVPLEEAGQPSFYLLVVRAPREGLHAVKAGDALRFLRRDGPGKRAMNVAEIAQRFRADKTAREVLEEVRTRSVSTILGLNEASRLVLTTIPRSPGRWSIDRAALEALEAERGDDYNRQPWTQEVLWWRQMETKPLGGKRAPFRNEGTKPYFHYELHEDGSSVLTQSLANIRGDNLLGAGILVRRTSALVEYAQRHAKRAGAGGGLLMALQLIPAEGAELFFHEYPGGRRPWPGGDSAEGEAVVELTSAPLSVSRELLTDIFHAFGVPEVDNITPDGRLSARHWGAMDQALWPPDVWAARG